MIGRFKAFAIGFLIGVFVAPRSGRASRQLLLERLGEFFDEGSRRLEELEEELVGHRRGERAGSRTAEEYEPEPLPDEPVV
jgi:gas vesicle protein